MERRRTGIEPAWPSSSATSVLKTAGATRPQTPPSGASRSPGGQGNHRRRVVRMTTSAAVRLTQYAHGGGCACKIPPGELEDVISGLLPAIGESIDPDLLVGLATGDDAAVV